MAFIGICVKRINYNLNIIWLKNILIIAIHILISIHKIFFKETYTYKQGSSTTRMT